MVVEAARWVSWVCDDGIMEISIDRPERKNALNVAMYQRLTEAVNAGASDDEVRVILLRGSEGAFCSGNDLADFANTPDLLEHDNPIQAFTMAFAECLKPIVVAVDGVAVGIGTTLLLHADLVYASPTTTFRLPFVSLGLRPELGSSWLLPRLAGHVKAAEWLLLGDFFTAEDAASAGLINAVVEDPLAEAYARAQKLAMQPPKALQATKQLMKEGERSGIARAMAKEFTEFSQALHEAEFRQAVTAFFEKKKSSPSA
jgi:enoyl-CoA hydratase/carnithine racemase